MSSERERTDMNSYKPQLTAYRLPLALLFGVACGTVAPLRGKIDVGREPYAVFVGGSGMSGDLYAVHAGGGPAHPITFTPVAELRPALAPNGVDLAFLRGESLRDSTPATVWLMNLLNGVERELELPEGAGRPEQVAWDSEGRSLVVESENGLYHFDAPPEEPNPRAVPDSARAAAESSLAVLLGDPVFAKVVPCKRTDDLCVLTRGGRSRILAQAAHDPVRWGTDSVAFFTVGGLLQIRPLARGRPRLLHVSDAPPRVRQVTFFQPSGSEERE